MLAAAVSTTVATVVCTMVWCLDFAVPFRNGRLRAELRLELADHWASLPRSTWEPGAGEATRWELTGCSWEVGPRDGPSVPAAWPRGGGELADACQRLRQVRARRHQQAMDGDRAGSARRRRVWAFHEVVARPAFQDYHGDSANRLARGYNEWPVVDARETSPFFRETGLIDGFEDAHLRPSPRAAADVRRGDVVAYHAYGDHVNISVDVEAANAAGLDADVIFYLTGDSNFIGGTTDVQRQTPFLPRQHRQAEGRGHGVLRDAGGGRRERPAGGSSRPAGQLQPGPWDHRERPRRVAQP